MKRPARALSISVTFFISWLVGVSDGWSQSDHKAKLVEGAKKEGRLVWYTSMAIDTSKPLLDAFLKEYPFIRPDLVRTGAEQMVNRIMNETRAGKWSFDVVVLSEIEVLVERNLISPYLSPEREAFDQEFKDSQGFWTGVYNNNLVLSYNTKMVSEKEAPKDYGDLLHPKWKGKIIMDSGDHDWFGTLVNVWGKERAVNYMKQLAGQAPVWRRGHGLIGQLLGAGEAPLGFAYNFRIERMKKEGAPVDWAETFNPIMMTVTGIGLSIKPNNPNTAKLFIDFVLSKKSQEMVRDMRRVPSRSDVKPLVPKMDQKRLKLKRVPKDVYLNFEQYATEFRKIFGL